MKTINNTKIIGLKEFRQNAESFIKRVNKGESFTVLKRSTPVFKITPVEEEENWETVADFTKIKKDGVSADKILASLRKLHG
ncbi:type II toxin-antitoxin system prevent-host-death family antitoxin [Candidatus Parcubacteria bacterium]|nr:type II toxin-antitoxin system prevent-host-death family antitoxin [Candidatus Parcubacteria bacterium]